MPAGFGAPWARLGAFLGTLFAALLGCFARRSSGGRFLFRCFFLGGLLSVVFVHDAGHVGAGFAKWRHSPILLDAIGTRVISGQCLDEIEIVAFQKFAQIAASARDIGLRIEGVVHPKLAGGAGHQLHESAGAFGRNGMRVESAFGVNHAVYQVWIKMIGGAGDVHDFIQWGRGRGFSRPGFTKLRFSRRRRGSDGGARIRGRRHWHW